MFGVLPIAHIEPNNRLVIIQIFKLQRALQIVFSLNFKHSS